MKEENLKSEFLLKMEQSQKKEDRLADKAQPRATTIKPFPFVN
jgi:hypothetical protein